MTRWGASRQLHEQGTDGSTDKSRSRSGSSWGVHAWTVAATGPGVADTKPGRPFTLAMICSDNGQLSPGLPPAGRTSRGSVELAVAGLNVKGLLRGVMTSGT